MIEWRVFLANSGGQCGLDVGRRVGTCARVKVGSVRKYDFKREISIKPNRARKIGLFFFFFAGQDELSTLILFIIHRAINFYYVFVARLRVQLFFGKLSAREARLKPRPCVLDERTLTCRIYTPRVRIAKSKCAFQKAHFIHYRTLPNRRTIGWIVPVSFR